MLNTKLLKKGSSVAVALSGGQDSVCLLFLLLNAAEKLKITVKAVNVEHGIRGESSISDSEFVKKLCAKNKVELKSYSVKVLERVKNTGESEEEAARFLRYQCFYEAISSGFCDFIATAHHSSDNAETVFFNLFRGSSIKGTCGIPEKSADGKIIRPLLYTSKKDIENYCLNNGLPFVLDESNYENKYSRNFIRNELFPQIEKKFPYFISGINRLSKNSKEEDFYLDKLAEKLTDENGSYVLITEKSDLVLFKRACVTAIKRNGFVSDYTEKHVEALCDLAISQTGKKVDLKGGLEAYKSYDRIIFKQKNEPISPLTPFSLNEINFGKYTILFQKIPRERFLSELNSKNENTLFFDADKVPENSVFRCRRQGDEIITFGGNKKSLKKFLTDKKVSSLLSEELPLLAKEGVIYMVCKIDVSALIKVDENTKNIVKCICINKGER